MAILSMAKHVNQADRLERPRGHSKASVRIGLPVLSIEPWGSPFWIRNIQTARPTGMAISMVGQRQLPR